jgi:AbrB family looped-hinge helix DNA binding protein
MNTVVVSSKYQVVIPKEVRERSGLLAGTAVEVISFGSRIELVPIRPMVAMKGIFPGIDTTIERDRDRL